MQCPLCGLKFKIENAFQLCRNCPLALKCKLVKCPNCGYEFPPSREINIWKRRIDSYGRKKKN